MAAAIARLLPFALLVTTAAGCADPRMTAVDLEVHFDDAWGLSALGVTAMDHEATVDATHRLQLRVPDDWAGTEIVVMVRGRRGDEDWASGTVTVTPVVDDRVPAIVTLARLPCGAWCTEGSTTCVGDGVAVCEQRDDDSCLEWSEPVPCGVVTPFCSLGACLATCVDECAPGETRCAGPGGVQMCGNDDGDDCSDWLPVVTCPGEQTCSNGSCRDKCDDECTAGDTRCAGGAVETCGDLDLDGCTEWGPAVPCTSGSCSGGGCDASCTDECTTSTCTGLTHHVCGQFDTDPCTDLSPGTSCVPTVDCVEGACSPAAGCTSTPTVCDDPPDPICIDASTLRTYDAAGTCSADMCEYPHTDLTCAGGCSGGACACQTTTCVETFATGQNAARWLALDGTDVYWTNVDGGQVNRRSQAGGPIDPIATGVNQPMGIAVDATSIYWTSWGTDTIFRRAKSGGATSTFAAEPELTGPVQIVLDSTHVYWAQTHGYRVLRKRKTGGVLETLADGGFSANLALDNQNVYWTTGDPINLVEREALVGGTQGTFASAQGGAAGIVLDATYVYWANYDEDQIARRTKAGGPIDVIATGQDGADGIAVDGTYLYWTNNLGNQVMRRAKNGTGPIQTLATGQAGAAGIAVNASYVYWTDRAGDQVMRIPLGCLCPP